MIDSPAEMEARDKVAKRDGFAKWMDQPATRMMVSMIPASEKQEVLETLLQEAFNAGYQSGGSQMVGSVFKAVFNGMEKNRGPERR